MEICRLCGGEIEPLDKTCILCGAPRPFRVKKSTLYRIACVVAVPLLAYLAGAMFAQGLIDQFTRAGIGG